MRKSLSGKSRLLFILGILALSIFMLAGCGGNDDSSSDDADKDKDAANWYQAVLDDESVTKEYPYYYLADIDQDGTDELFLSSTENAFIGADDKAKMMADVDGKATDVKELGGAGGESLKYDASDKSLFYWSRLSGEEHLIKYTYENGKLTEVQTADRYGENHDPNEDGKNVEDTYYVDGKKVTEDEAEAAIWDQYDDKATAITYSKDGKGSTSEAANDTDGDDDGGADDADDNDADGDD